jgi:hypothetical protein
MKFLVSWTVHADRRQEALKAFSSMTEEDQKAELDGVRLIGRWHDVVSFSGVAVAEADSAQAISRWLLKWNSIIDCEYVPVLDDEETRAIGRETIA